MFPRIMRMRCYLVVLLLLIQIVLCVWYFSSRKTPRSKSVLARLNGGSDTRAGTGLLHISDDPTLDVFRWYGADVCVSEGTSIEQSSAGKCVCLPGWGGRRCGLPNGVLVQPWMTDPTLVAGLQVRKRPRRLLLILNDFFHDLYLLQLTVRALADLIDVFIVGEDEAAYSTNTRNQSLVSNFRRGFLKEFHDKFVYVNISDGSAAVRGGSAIDRMHYTTDQALRQMTDIRMDDILLFSTSEQTFSRDFVLFLKLFHNYPQPVRCELDNYLYGFYWKVPSVQSKDVSSDRRRAKGDKLVSSILESSANDVPRGDRELLNKDPRRVKRNVIIKETIKLSSSTGSSNKLAVNKKNKDIGAIVSGKPVSAPEQTTPRINNLLLYNLYWKEIKSAPNPDSDLPAICAISVHVFTNVFESKVSRLHEEELLLKPRHLAFFESLQQPMFPWTYERAGWSCHLCGATEETVYHKLNKLPRKQQPHWFRPSVDSYQDMINLIADLRVRGQDERLVQALPNKVDVEASGSKLHLPNYVLKNRDIFSRLLEKH